MTVALLMVAGSIGALLRYEVELAVRRRTVSDFPRGTLIINVSGSFALGVLVGLAAHHGIPATVVVVVGTGLLGAYTTFSTFSFDTVSLASRGRWGAAAINLGVSMALGLCAGAIGLVVGHVF